MGMVVQHNMNALNAYNKLNANVAGLKKSSEKLSSGYRINRAGDDAAGLAISEKMRSQIKGLNQAVRNSQDGINMIQTFEGAAQESHSILQRMKELATESANGTYDNATDRAAIQLEFDQLNDELNQIADTDFNGTVVLNGGQMSDGLKAVDGEFDYANKAGQASDAQAKKLADLQKELAAVTDPSNKGMDVDDLAYTKSAADNLWKDLGLDTESVTDITITFTADKDGNFKATGAVDNATGDKLDVDLSNVTASNSTRTGATGEGGFKISTKSQADITNAIFDASSLNEGDIVAVKFTNTNEKTYAPKNVGFDDDAANELDGKFSYNHDAKLELTSALTDETMSQDWKTVLDKLSATSVKVAYTAAAASTGTALTGTVSIDDTTTFTIAADGKITLTAAIGSLAAGTEVGKFTADSSVVQLSSYTTAGAVNATYGLNVESYNAADPSVVPDASHDATATADVSAAEAKRAEIQDQIDNIGNSTGVSIADSFNNSTARMTYTDNITLQTGARTKDSVNFTFQYNTDKTADMGELKANLNISAREDGLATEKLSLATQDDANAAIDQIDKAINKVSMVRATFGSMQNRLEHKITNLTTTSENLSEAESSIRDTDMASEMMNYTKFNILQQAAQSMLAQANQQPQSILQLLG